MRSDYLNSNSSLSNQFLKVRKITENYTAVVADSGSIILVNPTAATTVTLPTISEDLVGWNVKVVIGEDAVGADEGMDQIVNIALTGTTNIGMIQEVDGTAGDFCVSGDDYIVNTASGAPGNTFDIWCDGYRWYIQGVVDDLSNAAFSTTDDTIA